MVDNLDPLDEDDMYIPTTNIEDGLYQFHFFLDDTVSYIFLSEGAEVLGVKVGMSIDEITSKLGEPDFAGYSFDWEDFYEVFYNIDGVQVGFYSYGPYSATVSAYIR